MKSFIIIAAALAGLAPALGAETTAYWTMALTESRAVADATGAGCGLTVRAANLGGVEELDCDVGWTTPPRPDAAATEDAAWQSAKMLRIAAGSKKGSTYQPVLSSTSAALDAALAPTNSFCVEGFFRASALPSSSSANHMFAYSTYANYGGWTWNIYGADANGNCAVKVMLEYGKHGDVTASKRATYALGSVASNLVLNAWNHYALAFDREKLRWSFYFNGNLIGFATGVEISDMAARTPSIYFFGCASGTAQIPTGDVTTWRVSRGRITPMAFLCGDPRPTHVWTGAASALWNTADTAQNWTNAAGVASAWTQRGDALFDGSGTDAVSLATTVYFSTLIFDSANDMTLTAASKALFGEDCGVFVKRGAGTLTLTANPTSAAINKSGNDVLVEEGTLRVSAANNNSALGDSTTEAGYDVVVSGGARLWIDQRNALGPSAANTTNNCRIAVLTNGVFDLSQPDGAGDDWFNIQSVGALDLLGGTLTPPEKGHGNGGYLAIRDRATFGRRPSRAPYEFEGDGTLYAWQIAGSDVEFRVEDVTGDCSADVVFRNSLLARDDFEALAPCGFRKTGDGTMALAQTNDVVSAGNNVLCMPTGTISVEAGELRVDGAYRGPSFAVADGAFLSGTGRVTSVTFASGAGFRKVRGEKGALAVSGTCAFGEAGTVAISDPNSQARHRLPLLRLEGDGAFEGLGNLPGWQVTLDGEAATGWIVEEVGGTVYARRPYGLKVVIR